MLNTICGHINYIHVYQTNIVFQIKSTMADSQRSRTRSGQDLNLQIKNVKFHKVEPLDLSKPQMLPTYKHLYQRFLTIKEDLGHGFSDSWGSAVKMVAYEFIFDRTMMNVYTIRYDNVYKKFDKILKF